MGGWRIADFRGAAAVVGPGKSEKLPGGAFPMNLTHLSPRQKKTGQKHYLSFTRFNALSFASLGDSILILYALKLGADDSLVAFLMSLFYLMLPMMLIGKYEITRLGTSRTFGFNWIFRTLFAALMLLAPVVRDSISPEAGLVTLVISVSGFFMFRSLGVTSMTPMLGDITSPLDQGEFISRVWMYSNLFYLFAIISITLLLGQDSSINMFRRIITFGVTVGLIASVFLFFIPASHRTTISGKQPIALTFRYILKYARLKQLFITWTVIYSGIALTVPFNILSLKKGYLFSDQNALFFSIIQISAGILVSYLNGLLLDRVGPRPMMFIFTSGLAFVQLLWTLAPATHSNYHLVTIFVCTGLCAAGVQTSLYHYFLNSMPPRIRLNASILFNIASGITAGLLGTFLGGGLLKLLRLSGVDGLPVYRIYFIIIFIFQGFILFQVYRLQPLSDHRIKDVLGILFSVRDWRAIFTLQKLAHSNDEKRDIFLMNKLGDIGSHLSEKSLVEYLKSPRFFVRTKAIQALSQIKFGDETAKLLIEELKRGEFTSGYLAASALGDQHVKSAIPALRQALESDDVFLQGKSMVALGHLGDEPSYPRIIEIFKSTDNPRLIIHGGHSLVAMREPTLSQTILKKLIQSPLPLPVFEELLFCLGANENVGDQFYQFYPAFQADPITGIIVLEDFFKEKLPENQPLKINLLASINAIPQPSLALKQLKYLCNQMDCPHLRALLALIDVDLTERQEFSGKIMFTLNLVTGARLLPKQLGKGNNLWQTVR
jgi:hypothetical protein